MEPMSLGSPVHSPILGGGPPTFPSAGGGGLATPTSSLVGTPTGHHHQPGFLPGYLMGESSQQVSSPTSHHYPSSGQSHHRLLSGPSASPGKLNRSLSQHHSTPTPQTPQKGGFLTPTTPATGATPASRLRGTPGAGGHSTGDKPGGPPTTGLFGGRGSGTPQHGVSGVAATPNHRLHETPVPSTPHLSFGGTPGQHHQSIREEVLNYSSCGGDNGGINTWITVFGFPPSAASYILSQFSQYGTVLQHHIPPNGNWMHLKYQTKLQCQKALSKSNSVIGGSLMIGVSPCTDPNVEDLVGSGSSAQLNSSVSSVLNQSHQLNASSVTTLNSSIGGTQLNRSIRPLAQAYKASTNENGITSQSDTPNKNGGIVGKAMEYIFGW